jgi:hypothetical protein
MTTHYDAHGAPTSRCKSCDRRATATSIALERHLMQSGT